MRRWLIATAVLVGIVVVGLPVSFIVTIILVPLWRWIEADLGIEAIGHSGPAEWCFYLVWALAVLSGVSVWWLIARRPPAED